jgi:hypothetical protein
MIDALILPALGLLIIGAFAAIWQVWLKKPEERAFRLGAQGDERRHSDGDPQAEDVRR